jgi:glycerol-3-phosphate dehydrogenase (NAD(P)+)
VTTVSDGDQIQVAVIGAGSWGTTVAALACANTPTKLWARREELADEINE